MTSNSPSPELTALIAYRQRPTHLAAQLAWWEQLAPSLRRRAQVVWIEADAQPSPGLAQRVQAAGMTYAFLDNPGVFHKTRALNRGLHLSRGRWVTPWDVDLLPTPGTLDRHLALAATSPQILASGYRLMAAAASVKPEAVGTAIATATVAPEDGESAIWKHLVKGERFGVLPFFEGDRLRKIGGWDEGFIGWGGEDQDLLERYLDGDRFLCRCPDLLYLHLKHDRETNWTETAAIAQNRQHYYAKMQRRRNQLS